MLELFPLKRDVSSWDSCQPQDGILVVMLVPL